MATAAPEPHVNHSYLELSVLSNAFPTDPAYEEIDDGTRNDSQRQDYKDTDEEPDHFYDTVSSVIVRRHTL